MFALIQLHQYFDATSAFHPFARLGVKPFAIYETIVKETIVLYYQCAVYTVLRNVLFQFQRDPCTKSTLC